MTNIFVAKLDYGVTQEDLKSLFEQFGKVNKVSLAMDKETGKSKGFAFIEMDDEASANEAIQQLDNSTLKGRQMAVKQAEDRSANKGGANARGGDRNNSSERPRREFNSESKPFERKPKVSADSDDDDSPYITKPSFIPLETENLKGEARKKDAPKKKEKPKNISDGNPRQQKMPAYKKSGKQNRFFDLDDDDY